MYALYDIPGRAGFLAVLKNGSTKDLHYVTNIQDDVAACVRQGDEETVEIPLADLVSVARFGEPIYPYLKSIDTVCNAPDSDL